MARPVTRHRACGLEGDVLRNGFAKIRSGLEEHLIAGRIGFFEAGVYLTIHIQADFRRGVWIGSAPRLLATAPRGASLRSVQRALEQLAEIGFLRTFRTHGARGNYTVLIHKYEPQFGALRGTRLNALASENWSRPIYERVAESDTVPVTEHDTESDTEDAPFQESLLTNHKSEKHTGAPAAPGGRATAALSGFDDVWKAYPKRVARKAAERAWTKIATEDRPTILANVTARATSEEWLRENGRYVPHLATYLNGQRWKDQSTEVNRGTTHPGGSGVSRSAGKTPLAAHSNEIGIHRKPNGFQGGTNASST